jgi:hypothetical protein
MTTLTESYGERFDLLLGPGDRYALESIGIESSPKISLKKTKEALREIRGGLSELGHNCRVLLGAQGPKMIEASLDADGVLLNYTDLEMAKWAVDQIGDRITENFQLGLFPPALIGPCERIRDNPAISHSAAMVAIGLGKSVADEFGLSSSLDGARKLLKEHREINEEVIAAVGEEILKRFAFCGTQEQLKEYTNELEKIGYLNVVFGPPVGMSKKGVETLLSAKNAL